VFVINGADGAGVGFGDHEHHRSIGTRAVDGTGSWGGEVKTYLATLCISPVAAARWTGGNDRIAGHHSSHFLRKARLVKSRLTCFHTDCFSRPRIGTDNTRKLLDQLGQLCLASGTRFCIGTDKVRAHCGCLHTEVGGRCLHARAFSDQASNPSLGCSQAEQRL